jgi:serine/threonine protein kinase
MNEPQDKKIDSQAQTRISTGADGASTDDAGEILDAEGLPPPESETLLAVGQSIGHPSIYATVQVSPGNGETLVEIGPAPSTQVETNASTRIVSPNLTESGRYDLLNELGRGGMGIVFKAFDKDLRRNVALKISRADRQTGRSHGRFIEEAQVQGQLSHPNIVPVHELGLDPRGRPYFTMKLVEGRSLASIIRDLRKGDAKARQDWPLSKRLFVFEQLLNCVAYAHARGVIHRDLKPDNLMLGDYGEVLLMDWGLARVLKKADDPAAGTVMVDTSRLQTPGDQTLDGQIVGTPAYMPPEQARGERDKIDERSDVYSLGAILYELLSLQPPYAAKTASDLISKVTSERPLPPSQKNKSVVIPRGLEALCMKCLEAERENRFQSVRELQAALDTWQRKLSESSVEGVGFALLGKVFTVALVTSVFLLTSLIISGPDKIDLETHLINPGIFAALMTLGFGSLIEWATLGIRNAFDGTQAVLFWTRAGVQGDELRGYFAAEACRRAKWVYLLPCLGALAVAIMTRNPLASIIAVQMFGAGLMCVLAIGLVEQGTYRRLDAMGEVQAQDHRDFAWRWVLTAGVFFLGLLGAHLAGWQFDRIPTWRMEIRRGTLSLHLVAVLAGVWALAHIAHPGVEIRRAFKMLFSRKLTKEQREEVGPMARQFATNAIIFGAIGSITWIGLHAPMISQGAVNQWSFFMGLTPLVAGMMWSFYFRWRGRGLNVLKRHGNLVQRRYLAYIDKPKARRGLPLYVLYWAPFIVGAIGSAIYLIWDAL